MAKVLERLLTQLAEAAQPSMSRGMTLRPLWTLSNLPAVVFFFVSCTNCVRPRPHYTLALTAWSRSVSSTDHGLLRGPVCDVDRRLRSVLPRPDHAGGDLRRAMEVIAQTATAE